MTTKLNFDEALTQFEVGVSNGTITTTQQIQDFVRNVSGNVLDANGAESAAERLLYSGEVQVQSSQSTLYASQITTSLVNSSDGAKVSIYQSEVGKLLDSQRFRQLVMDATGLTDDSPELNQLFKGVPDPITGTRVWGLWDIGSDSYVRDPITASFKIIAPNATDFSTLGALERDAQELCINQSVDIDPRRFNAFMSKMGFSLCGSNFSLPL